MRGVALRYMTGNQAPEVTKLEVPDLDAVNLDNPKKLKIKWTAIDPNEDELTYTALRPQGRLEELGAAGRRPGQDRATNGTRRRRRRGIYQVKVVASDRKDNPRTRRP